MALDIKFRAIVGPTYSEGTPRKNKLSAADGLMGIVCMLAWWGGGKNLFPEGLLPEHFAYKDGRGVITIDVHDLTLLTERMSQLINREIGQLGIGSLPIYLCSLRKGLRINGHGVIPAVDATYVKKEQVMTIQPKNYQKDLASGVADDLPAGLISS